MAQNKRRGRRRVAENKAPQRKPMKKRVVESQDKFQQMLEFLVNEDRAKAEELFHEIVVEKSRSIYEGLLEDEEEEVDESDDEEVDESDDEEVEEDTEELDEYDTTSYQDANDDDQDYQSGHEGETPGGVDYSWTGGQGTNEIQFGQSNISVRIPTEDGEFGEATSSNKEVAAIFSQHLAGVGADDDAIQAIEAAIDEADQTVDMAGDGGDFGENYYDEAEDDLEMGGDPEGDLSMDMGDEEGDMDMDAGEEGADDDRIADLEAELADLKAEFEELMADGGGDEEMDDMGDDEMGDEEGADDMDMGSDEGGDDMDMGDEEPEEEAFQYESKSNQPKSAAEQMREYVEKISGPNFPGPGKMGDNGAYTKSPVASKNDMGGTTANILNGGTSSETNVVGKGGTVQGNGHLNQTPKDMNTGNINVPGGKAGKNTWKNNSAGHGAERKGKPESADKGAGSPLNGAPKRAK